MVITVPRRTQGFTLVEMAIVMIIVGLLIVGVLKGMEMIRNAEIKTTVSQYQKLSAAFYTFRDKYGDMPGDMPDATARLPQCDGVANCVDGNGDLRLGTPVNATTDVGGTAGIQENIQFWKHLAVADVIEAISFDFSNAPGDSSYGGSHPAAKAGGGWNAITTADGSGDDEYGHNGLSLQISGTPNTNASALTPSEAFRIDALLDDGQPNSGTVKAESSATNCEDDATNTYIETGGDVACTLYIRVP